MKRRRAIFERPSRRQRSAWFVVLIVFVVILAGLWIALPSIAGIVLRLQLEAMGVPDPRVTVAGIGLGRARIVGVRLGAAEEARAEEIELDYNLADAIGGRFAAVRIRGLHVDLSLLDGRPSLGSLDPALEALASPDPAGAADGVPLPPIVLENAVAEFALPIGTVAVALSGSVTPTAQGTTAELEMRLESALARLAGRLVGSLGRDGNLEARLAIDQGEAGARGLQVGALAGDAEIAVANRALQRLDARLRLAAVAGGGLEALGGDLTVTGGPAAITARLGLGDSGNSFSLGLDASLRDLRALALSADLDLTAQAPVWALANLPAPESGRFTLHAVLDAPDISALANFESTREAPAGAESLSGSVTLDAADLAWPGLVREASLAGGLDVATADRALVFTAPAEWLGEARLDPQFVEGHAPPAEFQGILDGLLSATLATPFALRVEPRPEGFTVAGEATLSLAAETGETADLALAGRLSLGEAGQVGEFSFESAKASIAGFRYAGAEIANVTVTGAVAGSPTYLSGNVSIAAAAPSWRSGGTSADGLAFNLGAEIEYSEGTFALALGTDSRVSVRRLRSGNVSLAAPLDLALASEQVALTVDLDANGPLRIAHDLQLGPARLRVEAAGTAIDARLPRLRLAGAWSRDAGYSGTGHLAGGALSIPDDQVTASKIALDLALDPAGVLRTTYRIGEIASQAQVSWLPVLAVEGTARRQGDRVSFDARLNDLPGRLKMTVSGRHALASGRGEARIELAPITFVSRGLQPGDFFPGASAQIREAEGTTAIVGDIAWGGGGLTSKVELLLRDISFVTPQGAVTRINGVINFDRLLPISTPPGQQIAVAAVEAGLPFTDGLVTFRIEPQLFLVIEDAHLDLADGRVSLQPVRIDLAKPRHELRLDVSAVDLTTLLALAAVNGLTGTGKMSGHIPVVIDAGTFVIDNGALESDAPGELRYKPEQAPGGLATGGESVQLALSALTNFQYQRLRLTINRDAAGEMVVLMHVVGRNPDFYDGYPVEFNLNVTGRLDEILRRGLVGYRLPETIKENLKEFGKQ